MIVLARELNAELVLIDDRRPREIAKDLGFKVLGTVGILIKAARDGRVCLEDALDELTSKGFWISREVYEEALRRVREKGRT